MGGFFGDVSPAGTLAIGIMVGLLSTSVQSLGLTLQRKSHMLEDEKGPHEIQRPPYRRRRWQLGMAMFVISNILGSTIQISTLPLPVLSTLQAAGLVFNSICATLILGEPFTRWSLGGTALVAAGATMIAIFGAVPSPAHSLKELLDLLGRWQFIVWMVLQAIIVVGIAVTVGFVNRFKSVSQDPRFRLARGLAYGCISGILSAHSLLFAKSAVELILRTIADGENQFVHWQSWILVLGLVVLALSQLYYLHRGLKLVSTSVLYPLVFCVYNIIAILDGLIYFQETELITPLHGGLIALGTAILLAGVLALSWRLSDEQHPPAVGQSTLTPGLGFVEDTEGEEESAIDSDSFSEDGDGSVPPTYDTFAPSRPHRPSLSSMRKSSVHWRNEIWDELDDQHQSRRPIDGRQRSNTMPSNSEGAPLLAGAGRRITSMGSGGDPTTPLLAGARSGSRGGASGDSPRRMFRRRRKSTGFPGFQARRHERKTSSSAAHGVQDALGGIWKLRWWKHRHGHGEHGGGEVDNNNSSAIMSPPGSASGSGPWITGGQTQQRYMDDPEEQEEEGGQHSASQSHRQQRRHDRSSPPTSQQDHPRGDDAV
ncbi:DUF803 domain protein [Xylariaceae sp. FL0255]|nr:DUF803 domain protein [Xylariaceae sp. FL0255]